MTIYYAGIVNGRFYMELMNKTIDTKTESNTFTKRIGQTTYVVQFHYSENAGETMQEKINRMLATEVRRQKV